MQVMRFKKSKISWYKQERLIEHFVIGSPALATSVMLNMNRNTVWLYFNKLRQIISYEMEKESKEVFWGEVEVDESYFGGIRKGKRGRGARDKTPLFGLLKRGGKVYTKIIPDAKRDTLIPIIKEKVIPDSIIYTDYWRAYEVLDISGFRHMRINHNKAFVNRHKHIEAQENFWNQAKRHMRKFNGISRDNFVLYLKECEWRFNHSGFKSQRRELTKWIRAYLY